MIVAMVCPTVLLLKYRAKTQGGISSRAVAPHVVDTLEQSSDLLREPQNDLMLVFIGAPNDSWTILKAQESATHESNSPSLDSFEYTL